MIPLELMGHFLKNVNQLTFWNHKFFKSPILCTRFNVTGCLRKRSGELTWSLDPDCESLGTRLLIIHKPRSSPIFPTWLYFKAHHGFFKERWTDSGSNFFSFFTGISNKFFYILHYFEGILRFGPFFAEMESNCSLTSRFLIFVTLNFHSESRVWLVA